LVALFVLPHTLKDYWCGSINRIHNISIDKTSILFSKNVERSMRMKLLQISGFEEITNFGKYLGVPLIGRAPKRANFQYIIDQASTKLSILKANQLSFAGRVALAKIVRGGSYLPNDVFYDPQILS
jgi:hypothetical protein